ncbi:MAG TPA: LamG-like jellyroll fold domain-containing protein, partial [Methylomirabilota bacterium]|nr:LamG-like jellyroll fold domain-containing protein [Methylomirabilota bacterium]
DVSGDLQITGSTTERQVAYDGLEANTIYEVEISVTNVTGNRTLTLAFDTFLESESLVIEAEDYNFADDSVCEIDGTRNPEPTSGGHFVDNPIPSDFDGVYVNQGPNSYVDNVGVPGVDFSDTMTTAGVQANNAYRYCDPVGTQATTDVLRQKYIDAGVRDFHVHLIQPDEWLNYTRTFPAEGLYRVFLRASTTADQIVRMDRVSGDTSGTTQTTAAIGNFVLTAGGGFKYTQLTDLTGNPLIVSMSGVETVRLTALSANNNLNLNYVIFVPADASEVPPGVLAVSPADGESNVPADATIEVQLQDGFNPLDLAAIALFVNNTDVTAQATISATAGGATVSYTAGSLPELDNTARVEFNDDANSGPYSFEWSFSVRPDLGTGNRLVGFWDFNDASVAEVAADQVNGFVGDVLGGAAYTADAGGHYGWPGDRGMDFGTTAGGQRVSVTDIAPYLNAAAVDDELTVSLWLKWNVPIANSSAFWMVAPSAGSNSRGFQAHVPWGDGNIVFDTAGCCDAATQRIAANISTLPDFNWQEWHHYAFVKNGSVKQIWIDGVLFLEGTSTNPLPTDFIEMIIGAETPAANSIRAVIDDFAVFASPLSQALIEQLAAGASPVDFQIPEPPPAYVAGVSPAPDATGVVQGTAIEVSLANGETDVVQSTIQLFFDGADVTAQATITATASGFDISYTPADLGSLVTHTARVEFSDNATPANMVSSEWSFTSAAEASATGANIAWISFHPADDEPSGAAAGVGFTEAPDVGYTQLLEADGHTVTRFVTSGTPDTATLNTFDLVIISRSVPSGDYQDPPETAAWNGLTAPSILMGGYILRQNRLGFTTGNTIPDTAGPINLAVNDPTHPIFTGISLDGANTMVNPYADLVTFDINGTTPTVQRGISVNTDPVAGDGTVLATVATTGDPAVGGMIIGEYQAGATMGNGSADTLGGHRLVFLSGSREQGITSEGSGIFDLQPDGEQLFLNSVRYMAGLLRASRNIAWVSFHAADDQPSGAAAGVGFTEAPDVGYTQLLTATGHSVTRFVTSGTPDAATLNTFDLVIISRSVPSGDYQDPPETAAWNGLTAPSILMGGYILRNSRLGFTTGGTIPDTAGPISLTVNNPAHPIFQGIALDGANTMVNPYADLVTFDINGTTPTVQRGISVNTDPVATGGTVLATVGTVGDPAVGGMIIGEYLAGTTMANGSADTLAGHRLVFLSGSREQGITSEGSGIYDLEADGAILFLNAVDYMAAPGAAGPQFDSITLNGDGTATLVWSGGGTLQTTPTLSPPNWTTVDGAESPFIVTADGASAFYQLVAP